jgi:hypothetical protein
VQAHGLLTILPQKCSIHFHSYSIRQTQCLPLTIGRSDNVILLFVLEEESEMVHRQLLCSNHLGNGNGHLFPGTVQEWAELREEVAGCPTQLLDGGWHIREPLVDPGWDWWALVQKTSPLRANYISDLGIPKRVTLESSSTYPLEHFLGSD